MQVGDTALELQRLPPSVFSPVMATGIVCIAAWQQGQPRLSQGLFGLAVLMLVVLWPVSAWRLLRHPARVASDVQDHHRGPGFFTTVAATAVVGSGFVVVLPLPKIAAVLLALAAAAWLVITYAIFAGLATARDKPALRNGIDGSWLLAVVAMQSLAVLASLLSPSLAQPERQQLNFIALYAWLVGGVVYTWLMTLLLYRLLFFRFEAKDLTGPWWISMGAMAISALAGAQLVLGASGAPLLESLLPVLRGATLLFWGTGTWWLPLLVVLSVWRMLREGLPRYELSQWSAVFPLGMYSAATGKVGTAFGLAFLQPASTVFFWIALGVWIVCAAGWLSSTRPPPIVE